MIFGGMRRIGSWSIMHRLICETYETLFSVSFFLDISLDLGLGYLGRYNSISCLFWILDS